MCNTSTAASFTKFKSSGILVSGAELLPRHPIKNSTSCTRNPSAWRSSALKILQFSAKNNNITINTEYCKWQDTPPSYTCKWNWLGIIKFRGREHKGVSIPVDFVAPNRPYLFKLTFTDHLTSIGTGSGYHRPGCLLPSGNTMVDQQKSKKSYLYHLPLVGNMQKESCMCVRHIKARGKVLGQPCISSH